MLEISLPINAVQDPRNIESKTSTTKVPIKGKNLDYTGLIHDFHFGSMAGTYIDFPGHIQETGSDTDAATYHLERFYRMRTGVIHLDRSNKSGGVNADDLQCAANFNSSDQLDAIIINALGSKRFDDIEFQSVYLTLDAVDWIISKNIKLLISDIYESNNIEGVFYRLFKNGLSAVCFPTKLAELSNTAIITVSFPAIKQATQVPCRIIVE